MQQSCSFALPQTPPPIMLQKFHCDLPYYSVFFQNRRPQKPQIGETRDEIGGVSALILPHRGRASRKYPNRILPSGWSGRRLRPESTPFPVVQDVHKGRLQKTSFQSLRTGDCLPHNSVPDDRRTDSSGRVPRNRNVRFHPSRPTAVHIEREITCGIRDPHSLKIKKLPVI